MTVVALTTMVTFSFHSSSNPLAFSHWLSLHKHNFSCVLWSQKIRHQHSDVTSTFYDTIVQLHLYKTVDDLLNPYLKPRWNVFVQSLLSWIERTGLLLLGLWKMCRILKNIWIIRFRFYFRNLICSQDYCTHLTSHIALIVKMEIFHFKIFEESLSS